MSKIDDIQKIISLHLTGKSLRDIEKEIDVSKSSVSTVINDWKDGKIQYFQQAIPYESKIIEISKFMDKNHMDLQELRKFSSDLAILQSNGLGRDQIFSMMLFLKDLKPEELATFSKTAITLNQNGVNYSDLEEKVKQLQNQSNQLDQAIMKKEDVLKLQEEKIQSNRNRIMEQQMDMDAQSRKLEEIKKDRFMQEKLLSDSQRINGAMEKMNIDPDKTEVFFQAAHDLNYSAEDFENAMFVWDTLPENIDRSVSVLELRETLEIVRNSGWDFPYAIALGNKFQNITGSREKVLETLTNLDLSLTNIKKEIDQKKKEMKGFKDEVKKLSLENIKVLQKKEQLLDENKTLEEQIERSKETHMDLMEKSIKLRKEMGKMQEAINAGKALTYFLKNNGEVDLTYFSKRENMINDPETYKILSSSLLNIILIEFKDEVALVEFPDRKLMKIIDGDKVKAAEETIKLSIDAENKIKEYNKIRNWYSSDYEGFFKDLLQGKVKISKELTKELTRSMYSIFQTRVNWKLFEQLSDITSKMTETAFPILTLVEGIPNDVLIPYDSFTKAFKNNVNTFGVFDPRYDKMIEISTCDAMKYFIIELSDPKIGKELLKRFRESMERNGGFHVPIEDDQPGFKLTPIEKK